MEEYIAPLWIVIFLFLALTVLFVLSKLLIIRNKMRTIDSYLDRIDNLYQEETPEGELEEE